MKFLMKGKMPVSEKSLDLSRGIWSWRMAERSALYSSRVMKMWCLAYNG